MDLKELENEVLDLDNVLIPLQSTYTQSYRRNEESTPAEEPEKEEEAPEEAEEEITELTEDKPAGSK